MFKKDWTTFSNSINQFELNIEHNWEDLCTFIKNEQTCTSIAQTISKEFVFMSLMVLHCRFANAKQGLLCKSNW